MVLDMDFDKINQNAIQEQLLPLIGKRVWQPMQNSGSFLTFEFGAKVFPKSIKSKLLERIRGPRPIPDRGEWHLWIYMCAWRIEKGSEVLAGSEDDRPKIKAALQFFENKAIFSVEILSRSLDTLFAFEDGLTLHTFSMYPEECKHWVLFTPGGNVLSLGPGSSWSYGKSNDPNPHLIQV